MSWSESGQGAPNDAKQKVQVNTQVPSDVKQAFDLVVNALPHSDNIVWGTHGHLDTGQGGQGNIHIDVRTVPPPPKS